MKPYLLSLLLGLLVGVIYGLFKVRSPAPPVIALVGLLGILVGEQLVPVAQRLLSGKAVSAAEVRAACSQHMFGQMPKYTSVSPEDASMEDKGSN